MKKNKGFTLIELLICISFISIVVYFMFRLIVDVRSEDGSTEYIRENQVNRNEIMRNLGVFISPNGVCDVVQNSNTNTSSKLTLKLCNGKDLVIEATKSSTASNFKITYDSKVYAYPMKGENAYYNPKYTVVKENFMGYEYTKINYKTTQKGLRTTPLDDIEIYWISKGLDISASQIRYSNPNKTDCKNVQCALDEISLMVGE